MENIKQGPHHKHRISFIFLHMATEGRKKRKVKEKVGMSRKEEANSEKTEREVDVGQSTKK